MKQMFCVLAVCALFSVPVMAVPTGLDWQRGDAGTTYQVWTFDDADNPAVPEIDENPYGVPLAEMVNGAEPTDIPACFAFGHYDGEYLGRTGVWSGDPLEISLYIPNREVRSDWKEIWLEIGWRGETLEISVEPTTNSSVELLWQDTVLVDELNGWHESIFLWHIEPNPDAEFIYVDAWGTGGQVDYISVDTICIPAPGAILLGGMGVVVVGLLRRRRTF